MNRRELLRAAVTAAAAGRSLGAEAAKIAASLSAPSAALGAAISGALEVGSPPPLYPSTAPRPPDWALDVARWREAFNEANCRPPDPNVAAIKSYSPVYRAIKNTEAALETRYQSLVDRAWKIAREIGS